MREACGTVRYINLQWIEFLNVLEHLYTLTLNLIVGIQLLKMKIFCSMNPWWLLAAAVVVVSVAPLGAFFSPSICSRFSANEIAD